MKVTKVYAYPTCLTMVGNSGESLYTIPYSALNSVDYQRIDSVANGGVIIEEGAKEARLTLTTVSGQAFTFDTSPSFEFRWYDNGTNRLTNLYTIYIMITVFVCPEFIAP